MDLHHNLVNIQMDSIIYKIYNENNDLYKRKYFTLNITSRFLYTFYRL